MLEIVCTGGKLTSDVTTPAMPDMFFSCVFVASNLQKRVGAKHDCHPDMHCVSGRFDPPPPPEMLA
jgi:hypothetical protein